MDEQAKLSTSSAIHVGDSIIYGLFLVGAASTTTTTKQIQKAELPESLVHVRRDRMANVADEDSQLL